MPITVIEIGVQDLKYGMFVSSLDRPWLETPFPIQGFIVESEKDKERLSKYCQYVYIDVQKSKISSIHKHIVEMHGNINAASTAAQIYKLTHRNRIAYEKTTSREDEIKTATKHFSGVETAYQNLLHDVEKDIPPNMLAIKNAIKPMVRSIIRNPDAFIWLTYLKSMDSYAYHHAISCSVWAVAFGRHLGLPVNMLNSLATGCFLLDIGKSKLPKALLNSTKILSDEEFELIKQHVTFGLEILNQSQAVDQDVRDMVKTHHERHNGSGYPQQLDTENIPLFGRIAGLVDVYDAITSHRTFRKPIPAHEAIASLYRVRGTDFQSELIEQFIQVVGVYPVGCLVELSNGTVGVVIAQNEYHRLRPKVMVLLDKQKQLLGEFYTVDLRTELDEDDSEGLIISKGLPPGAHGLDHSLYYF